MTARTSLVDTVLNEPAEVHALTHGVYHGLRSWSEPMASIMAHPDVVAEPHYFKAGYVVGKFLPIVGLWALARLNQRSAIDIDADRFMGP